MVKTSEKNKTHRHTHRPVEPARAEWTEKDPKKFPVLVQNALREAMKLEEVPIPQYDDFLWIIAQESSGVVDVRNARSTARGLFQLLRARYELNPRGERSFGDAVEECQGGIHYVIGRYHSATFAKNFGKIITGIKDACTTTISPPIGVHGQLRDRGSTLSRFSKRPLRWTESRSEISGQAQP
jgi:hypothetical protein